MGIETQVELNEEALKAFIADRAETVNKAKSRSISKLKKQLKHIRNDQENSSGAETDSASQIEVKTEALSFLSDVPDAYLMSLALLDKKTCSDKYANSNSGKKIAVHLFSSQKNIVAEVAAFQEQYHTTKKIRTRLLSKVVENIDSAMLLWSVSEEHAGAEAKGADIATNKKGSKVFQAEKRKTAENPNSSPNETWEECRDGVRSKKMKLNAVDKVLTNGQAALEGENYLDSGEYSGNADSNEKRNNWFKHTNGENGNIQNGYSEESPKKDQWNNNRRGFYNDFEKTPRGGFMGRNNSGRDFRGRGRDRARGHGQNRSNYLMRRVPKDSVNLISVSDDWKKLSDTPKTDEEKPSLLRPRWLTNPEEFKPKIESHDTFKQGRGNFHSNRGRRGGFRGRGRY